MRAPASRGPTATTSTWPSSMTTWTRPSRRYKLPWTNCAVNPSGCQWTGCTEDQTPCSRYPLWAGHTDPPACVRVSDHKAKEEEKNAEILLLKSVIENRLLSLPGPARRATFSTQNSKGKSAYLFYNFLWKKKSFYSMWNPSENETKQKRSCHWATFSIIYCSSYRSFFVVVSFLPSSFVDTQDFTLPPTLQNEDKERRWIRRSLS